ncbi:MAG: FlgD immunoglobulin-like domain containing protein, partial [Desulfobulbaceae bacterium]|nr:FlgD immunoglobulin-like domain containing protein [Desulfobulbaceae bacterium]
WQESVGSTGPGPYQVEWDGKSSSGSQLPDGLYHYEVEAVALTGEMLPVSYRSTGKVTGVNFEMGTTVVTLDNMILAKTSDIIQVK